MAQFFKIKIIISDKETGEVIYDNMRFLPGSTDIEKFTVSPKFEWSDSNTVYSLDNGNLSIPSRTEATLTSVHYDYSKAKQAKEAAISEIKSILEKYNVRFDAGWEWDLSSDIEPFTTTIQKPVIIDIQLWKGEKP